MNSVCDRFGERSAERVEIAANAGSRAGDDDPFAEPAALDGSTGNRKHPTFARRQKGGGALLMAWTEGTGWEKGGTLVWELQDATGLRTASGRADGVPVWGFASAIADRDGGFTLIY